MLVNNNRFEMMYKSIYQAPTKQIKLKYKNLATYLEFLKKRDKIENIPKEAALGLLWKWLNELKWKYQIDNLHFIKEKLCDELLTKIRHLTSEVIYILKYFAVREKSDERTVIVDYNLVERLKKLGFTVK